MFTQQYLIRIIANFIYFLKKKELSKNQLKFLVFTGTVGKTTLRDAIAFSLQRLGFKVQSSTLPYTNELGILLTALGLNNFSPKKISSWQQLVKKRIVHEEFICIELGADFYQDIEWFLKRFKPFAVFISGIAEKSWSRDVNKIFMERKKLLEHVAENGFIFYNLDDNPTQELIQKSKIRANLLNFSLNNSQAAIFIKRWTQNIYLKDVKDIFNFDESVTIKISDRQFDLSFTRPLFEPQIYALAAALGFADLLLSKRVNINFNHIFDNYSFLPRRLGLFKAKNNALIIEDSYKATPMCTFWYLEMARRIKAKKKILLLTEIRPLKINIENFYQALTERIKFFDSVYFWGPHKTFNFLHERNTKAVCGSNIKFANAINPPDIVQRILTESASGDIILIKGSFRYQLDKIRELLI